MRKNKIIAIMMAATFVCTAFTGCGKNDPETTTEMIEENQFATDPADAAWRTLSTEISEITASPKVTTAPKETITPRATASVETATSEATASAEEATASETAASAETATSEATATAEETATSEATATVEEAATSEATASAEAATSEATASAEAATSEATASAEAATASEATASAEAATSEATASAEMPATPVEQVETAASTLPGINRNNRYPDIPESILPANVAANAYFVDEPIYGKPWPDVTGKIYADYMRTQLIKVAEYGVDDFMLIGYCDEDEANGIYGNSIIIYNGQYAIINEVLFAIWTNGIDPEFN